MIKKRIVPGSVLLLLGLLVFVFTLMDYPAAIAETPDAPAHAPSPKEKAVCPAGTPETGVKTTSTSAKAEPQKVQIELRVPARIEPVALPRLSDFHSFSMDHHQDIWSLDSDRPPPELSVYITTALMENPHLPKDNPPDALIRLYCIHKSCAVIRMAVVDRLRDTPVWQTETGAYQGYFREKNLKKMAASLVQKLAEAYQQDSKQAQPISIHKDRHISDYWWHWW